MTIHLGGGWSLPSQLERVLTSLTMRPPPKSIKTTLDGSLIVSESQQSGRGGPTPVIRMAGSGSPAILSNSSRRWRRCCRPTP